MFKDVESPSFSLVLREPYLCSDAVAPLPQGGWVTGFCFQSGDSWVRGPYAMAWGEPQFFFASRDSTFSRPGTGSILILGCQASHCLCVLGSATYDWSWYQE